jgi:hypothetical protein
MQAEITLPVVQSRGCPILGIPVAGTRPFCVSRDRYNAVMRSINVTDYSIETKPVIAPGYTHPTHAERFLTVCHVTGKVRGRYVFRECCHDIGSARYAVWKWTDKQREARKKKQAKPANKHAALVAKLQRELGELYLHAPKNPLVYRAALSRQADKWERDAAQAWQDGKTDRKKLARIAGLVLRMHMTPTHAYKAIRDAGLPCRTLSQLTTNEKQRYGLDGYRLSRYHQDGGYWQQLPAILLQQRKPYDAREFNIDRELARHAEARKEYADTLRQTQSLKSQIAALVEMQQASGVCDASL